MIKTTSDLRASIVRAPLKGVCLARRLLGGLFQHFKLACGLHDSLVFEYFSGYWFSLSHLLSWIAFKMKSRQNG